MKSIIFLFILLQSCFLFSQSSSRNGTRLSPSGTIRAFIVFAEPIGDPLDRGSLGDWAPGELPPDIDNMIDHEFTDANSINGYLTKYIYETSLGNLIFLGDYYPELVQIPFYNINGYGLEQVIEYLDSLPGSDITTAHGYSINSDDFDMWTPTQSYYPKLNSPDQFIDVLIILWRNNSAANPDRNGGNSDNLGSLINLKNKIGTNFNAKICTEEWLDVFRHEFAHALLGGNQFHSGGAGGGIGTYLTDNGGYSLLSSWNTNLNFVNGWDRWRLGWKSSNNYYISARTTSYTEVNAEFEYGQALPASEYILRDFATYGDVIRIKLPYLKSINPDAKDQYIIIENHQLFPEKIEYDEDLPKGIRLNIQIGNDALTPVLSTTNYISPISGFGNYDFTYSTLEIKDDDILPPEFKLESFVKSGYSTNYKISTTDSYSNPFTGYNLLQCHAINYIDPNGNDYDMIYNKEMLIPKNVYYNGD